MTDVRRVLVVGTGLIGTSIGLALRDVAEVLLDDPDPVHLRTAESRGAGVRWDGSAVDLAVVAAPPAATGPVAIDLLRSGLASTVSHVGSIQSRVQAEVEAAGPHPTFCGGHPLAGRERGGPDAASAQLFADRVWVVCPAPATSAAAEASVRWLAESCGAVPVVLTAEEHDRTVALTSHLPQVVSSAVAAALERAAADEAERPFALAGQGLQDTTRIAASAPSLWREVLAGNARHVAPLVRSVSDDLRAVADALDAIAADQDAATAADTVTDLLRRGNAGRARVPVKDRAAEVDLVTVGVRVPDEPGQLAGVLATCAQADVNVEDVRVEHLRGRPRGVIELLVASSQEQHARTALAGAGWDLLGG